MPQDLHERVLHDVAGVVRMAGDAQGHGLESRLESGEQGSQAFGVVQGQALHPARAYAAPGAAVTL